MYESRQGDFSTYVSTLLVPCITLGWCPSLVSGMSAMLPHDGVIAVAATLVVHADHLCHLWDVAVFLIVVTSCLYSKCVPICVCVFMYVKLCRKLSLFSVCRNYYYITTLDVLSWSHLVVHLITVVEWSCMWPQGCVLCVSLFHSCRLYSWRCCWLDLLWCAKPLLLSCLCVV